MVKRLLPILVVLAGCHTFQDPDIVIDFRVIGMRADIPEQIIDIDITKPPKADEVLAQLVDTQVCALMSDQNFDRQLRWSATLCNLDNAERCTSDVQVDLGHGIWEDPDTTADPTFCIPVKANGNLLGVALDYLNNDSLHGLGGIYYGVSLRVGGAGGDPDLDLYAAKSLRIQPRIPPELMANNNPYLDHLEGAIDGGTSSVLALGRCWDQTAPLEIPADSKLRIYPIEPDDARETYVVPTLDGMSRQFTESLTYQYLATAGGFSTGNTGGPRDPFGNPPQLWTDWHAPPAKDLDGPRDIDLWVIQRDERLGEQWYQTCVRVVPP